MTASAPPLSRLNDANHAWLERTLKTHGCLSQGHITQLMRSMWRQSRHSDLVRLKIRYSDEARSLSGAPPPPTLLLKMHRSGIPAKANPVYAQKEFEFYQTIARKMNDPPCARCYDAALDIAKGTFHFLLEDLSGSHEHVKDPLPPTAAACERIMDSLARLHAAWWDDPRIGTTFGKPYREERWNRRAGLLDKRVRRLMTLLNDRISASRRQIYLDLCAVFPRLLRRQQQGHLTVTHGDAHYQNFLISRDGNDCRIIDWEDWELAPATDDLAFLIAVLWFSERRQRLEQPLLRHYHESLMAAGVRNYTWGELWEDYRLSVIKYLCKPVFQWANGASTTIWWDNLERVLTAYEELDCADIMAQLKSLPV